MNQPNKFAPVLISTFVMLFLTLFPVVNLINLLCCAGIILGGAAGTWYYSNQLRKIGQSIQNRDGIMIGVISGLISAVIYVIVSAAVIMISKQNPVEVAYKVIEQYGFAIPPETEKMLQSVYEEYQTKGFSLIMIIIELVSRIIMHCGFGLLGGLLTSIIINKKSNQI
jgi:hypothetical protein